MSVYPLPYDVAVCAMTEYHQGLSASEVAIDLGLALTGVNLQGIRDRQAMTLAMWLWELRA